MGKVLPFEEASMILTPCRLMDPSFFEKVSVCGVERTRVSEPPSISDDS